MASKRSSIVKGNTEMEDKQTTKEEPVTETAGGNRRRFEASSTATTPAGNSFKRTEETCVYPLIPWLPGASPSGEMRNIFTHDIQTRLTLFESDRIKVSLQRSRDYSSKFSSIPGPGWFSGPKDKQGPKRDNLQTGFLVSALGAINGIRIATLSIAGTSFKQQVHIGNDAHSNHVGVPIEDEHLKGAMNGDTIEIRISIEYLELAPQGKSTKADAPKESKETSPEATTTGGTRVPSVVLTSELIKAMMADRFEMAQTLNWDVNRIENVLEAYNLGKQAERTKSMLTK